MAAIPENPNEEDLVGSFSDNTLYAFGSDSPLTVQKELAVVRRSLLADVPFAIAASPLNLTEIGNAVNLTGFSPESCRKILASLQSLKVQPEMRIVSLTLLRQLAGVPEQTQTLLTEIISGKKKKFVVKDDDLESLLNLWLDGAELVEMFQGLPRVLRSKRKDRLEDWLEGRLRASTWDADFDKFSDLTIAVFEGFLPWLLRACSILGGFVEPVKDFAWREWTEELQTCRTKPDEAELADRLEE